MPGVALQPARLDTLVPQAIWTQAAHVKTAQAKLQQHALLATAAELR